MEKHTQQECHEIQQQSFIFEIKYWGEGPTPKTYKATDNEAVCKPDDHAAEYSNLDRYVWDLDFHFHKKQVEDVESK
jgi:hypothetical protein